MNKIWLNNYPDGMPEFISEDLPDSLTELFAQQCEQFPSRLAFTNMGTSLTYAEVDAKSSCFAGFLLSLGLKPQDRVAIMLPNILQYPVSLIGIIKAGLIVVNVNPLYTTRELKEQLTDSGAKAIIILENFAHVFESVKAETHIQHVIITGIGDMFAAPKSLLTKFVVKHVKKMVPEYRLPGAIAFNKAVKQGAGCQYEPHPCRPDDIVFLQYTGGTTGISKGAILTHKNILSNIEQTHQWITHGNLPGKQILPGEEIFITALPLYHIFSLTANFFNSFKLGAENVLITNPRDLKGFVKELKGLKFTIITCVNTLFDGLLNTPGFAEVDFSSLKIALAGGMATRATTAERWLQTTGNTIIEAYGLTEASPAVCLNPINCSHFSGSIGLPLPSTECVILDENEIQVPLGETGELCLCGPQVMQGYWEHPEETKLAFTNTGLLKTGDVARMDEHGFIYLMDRKKDMLLVSGFNVYPNEIEAVVAAHPDIQDCAAIGVPDQKSGEAIKIFVVKSSPAVDKQVIQEYCRLNLTGYKVPKFIEFRESLPKSPLGKVLRRELK